MPRSTRNTGDGALDPLESRLQDVENNFRLLFEQSPNAIVLFDPESWKPVEFNDLAAQFMGYTREEFAKLTISDLEASPRPDETRQHVEEILRSEGDVFEALHKAKDGSLRHVIVSLRTTVWEGRRVMLTLWHDITAQVEAKQALEASERRLQSIFDSAMDAVVLLDQALDITAMNPAAERTFRCRAHDRVGSSVRRLFSAATLDRLFPRTAEGQGAVPGSTWVPGGLNALRSNGEIFPVELTVSPFEIDGATFFTLILRDVNDRLRTESELLKLQEDKRLLQEQLQGREMIIGDSPGMRRVLSHAEKVAATDSTVLVLGETGTGKELVARAIHKSSVRRNRTMVTVNCAALPKDLLESELFGHEKGAFTGATQSKRGRFEIASGGTLFLDEVGELSAEAQSKLLRALQEGEIQRVGGETTIRVNVRVIAATHRDLMTAVEEGSFRSDLYYRLSVFPLHLPPLRERRTDLPRLIEHFIGIYSSRFGKTFNGFDRASLDQLLGYHWPGNVRELQNVIERAAILSTSAQLSLEGSLLNSSSSPVDAVDDGLEELNRRHIVRVLTECSWVIEGAGGAALRLGIKPSTLRFRMRKLGIERAGPP